ncbi:hypothetical protein VPH35_049967 [Triticum aestivum]
MGALPPPSHGGQRRPWQDLPSELLDLVIQRVPSHAGRIRMRAVCRPWHAGARLQPPLPALLPWLALRDGSFLSLPDGEVHRRVLLPDDNVAHRVSTGSTLFLAHSDDGCSLMNPLSRETTAPRRVDLNCLCRRPGVDDIRKVVAISDHAVAVRTGEQQTRFQNVTICIRWPQSTTTVEWRWIRRLHPKAHYVIDMALFQEKLHLLTAANVGECPSCLYVMDIVRGNKRVNIQCMISMDNTDQSFVGTIRYYLVASGDRLLMVKQKRKKLVGSSLLLMPARFEVFDAVDLSSGHGRWREMNTLMGHALFLSEGCSESLPVSADQYYGAREDCIYFLCERNRCYLYCGMYDMTKGTVSPLPFDTVLEPHHGPLSATWSFPAYTCS